MEVIRFELANGSNADTLDSVVCAYLRAERCTKVVSRVGWKVRKSEKRTAETAATRAVEVVVSRIMIVDQLGERCGRSVSEIIDEVRWSSQKRKSK